MPLPVSSVILPLTMASPRQTATLSLEERESPPPPPRCAKAGDDETSNASTTTPHRWNMRTSNEKRTIKNAKGYNRRRPGARPPNESFYTITPCMVYHGVSMALNLKNADVERLAAEVSRLTGESKTEAIRKALEERRQRLKGVSIGRRRARGLRFLEKKVWPALPR